MPKRASACAQAGECLCPGRRVLVPRQASACARYPRCLVRLRLCELNVTAILGLRLRIIRISGDLRMAGAVAQDRLWGRGGGRSRAYPPDRQKTQQLKTENIRSCIAHFSKHKILPWYHLIPGAISCLTRLGAPLYSINPDRGHGLPAAHEPRQRAFGGAARYNIAPPLP